MKLPTLLYAILLSAARPGSAGDSVDVFADYEDISIDRNPALTEASTKPFDSPYRQLNYSYGAKSLAYRVAEIEVIDTKPNGFQAVLGMNNTHIRTAGVKSILPKALGMGCVAFPLLVFSLGVECTVRVTAFYDNGTEEVPYPTTIDCEYPGHGELRHCLFPKEWNETIELGFQITQFHSTVPRNGRNDGERIDFDVDSKYQHFLLDDLWATYNCEYGVDAKTGFCSDGPDSGSSHENELRK